MLKKRGRKPKNSTSGAPISPPNDIYFSEEQEQAVREFLTSENEQERNRIYESKLKFALEKMTESIINRYKLYSGKMSYEDLFDDTLSFLHTKLYMFDPLRGKKAYSYFGTIIKRRLQNNRKKEVKDRNKVILYDDVYKTLSKGDDIPETEYREDNTMNTFFFVIIEDINILLQKNQLKENEKKVALSILEIVNTWDSIYLDESKKFKKNFILECIRNMTLLNTQEISLALKTFKVYYINRKKRFLKELEQEEEQEEDIF